MAEGILASTTGMFKDGTMSIVSNYGWVLWLFVGLAVVIVIAVIIKALYNKKTQWTHKLEYRRVLPSGYLSKTNIIKMRRFPLIARAEIFELEKPLLGGYLISELDSYNELNMFSIIIDKSNRIYKNTGEKFCPDSSSVLVSAKHAEIDLARAELKAKYQNINKTTKRVEWAQIAKFAMIGLLILAIMIVSIKGIGAWSNAQESKAAQATAEAQAWIVIQEVMINVESNTNANILLTERLKELYGTNNLQSVVREVVE